MTTMPTTGTMPTEYYAGGPADQDDLPLPYEIDETKQVLYAAVGPWSPTAIAEWVARVLRDPKYIPGMRGMLNLRFVAGPLPDVPTMGAIARAMLPLTTIPARTRWAVLVNSPAVYARVRLFETLTSAGYIQFRGFDNDDDALAWLGIESVRNPWLHAGDGP